MSISKKKYLFTAERYQEWASVLENKSLAFNIKEHETVKTKTGSTEIKMGITISESLLPRHCNPELVEQALASLEKNPDNFNLLNTLAEYTKNNRFERVGYYGLGAVIGCIAVAAVIASIAITLILISYNAAIFWMAISAVPLELFFTVNLFSICIYSIVTSSIFLAVFVKDALNTHFLNALGLKIGRGVGYLVKGINNQPGNLQALDEKLNELINEQAKMSQHEESVVSPVPRVTAQTAAPTKLYPSLSFHYNDNADLSDQDTASNTNDSSQQVPKNR